MKKTICFLLAMTMVFGVGIAALADQATDSKFIAAVNRSLTSYNEVQNMKNLASVAIGNARNHYSQAVSLSKSSFFPQMSQLYNDAITASEEATNKLEEIEGDYQKLSAINHTNVTEADVAQVVVIADKMQQDLKAAKQSISKAQSCVNQLVQTIQMALEEIAKQTPTPALATPASLSEQEALKAECINRIQEHYNIYFDPKYEYTTQIFLKVDILKNAINPLSIVIEKPKKGYAQYVKGITSNYIMIETSPIVDKSGSLTQAIFHESIHAVEDSHGDMDGAEDRESYLDRNTDYIQQRIERVGTQLKKIENGASTGSWDKERMLKEIEYLYLLWEKIHYNGNDLPSLSHLEEWFGFKFNLDDIVQNYIDHSQYPILREAFAEYLAKVKLSKTKEIPGQSGIAKGRFPDTGDYSGNITEYSISGVNVTKTELSDSSGYTRKLTGTFGGKKLTVDGKVISTQGDYSEVTVKIQLYSENNLAGDDKYIKTEKYKIGRKAEQSEKEFHVEMDIPADATGLDVFIINKWESSNLRYFDVEGRFERKIETDTTNTPSSDERLYPDDMAEMDFANNPPSQMYQNRTIVLTPSSNDAEINGQPIKIENPPVVLNDRTYVPLRFVADALGAGIKYLPDYNGAPAVIIYAADGSREHYITLRYGSNTYIHNRTQGMLDAAPVNIDGRTFVPIRFISEALGANVSWDEATGKVTIDKYAQID